MTNENENQNVILCVCAPLNVVYEIYTVSKTDVYVL